MRHAVAFVMFVLAASVLADQADDDAAFFEFLGSFEAEDDEWLDSLLLEETAADDQVPVSTEPEEDQ